MTHALLAHEKSADKLPLFINIVSSCTDQNPVESETTWSDFCALLTAKPTIHGKLSQKEYQNASPETKKREKDHAGWIPASLKIQPVGRKQENIEKLYFVVLDCDGGISVADAAAILEGYEAVIHTTYSHTKDSPKFRAVLPLAEPIGPDQIKPFFDFMQERFDNKLDRACMEPARMFYLPACPPDSLEEFEAIHLSGQLLCLAEVTARDDAISVAASSTEVFPVESGSTDTKLATVDGVPVGSRNMELTRYIGHCINKGYDAEKTLADSISWNALLSTPMRKSEVKNTVQSIFKTAARKATLSAVELHKVVKHMNESYAFLYDSSLIVRLEDRAIQTKEMMSDRYSNTTVVAGSGDRVKRTTHFQAWFESPERREHIGFTLQPGEALIVNDRINLWTGWGAIPSAGNVKPWNDLMDYLIGAGTEERKWLEQWISYPLKHPGTKLSTAVVIWSQQQGVGKSLLGETIKRLYGKHSKTITATELHDKNNGWAEDAVFVLGEENSSSDHRADANRLKHLVTGSDMFIHEKYKVARVAPNLLNFMFTSNHPNAFHLDIHDRRFFVSSIDGRPKSADFYTDFVSWRDAPCSMDALMDHLLKVDLTGFEPFGHAPISKAKEKMIEESKTEIERWISDLLTDDYIDNELGTEIISIPELVALHHSETGCGKTGATALGRALNRQRPYEMRRLTPRKKRLNLVTLRRPDFWNIQEKQAWADEYNKRKSISEI